jgi:hypothetical protein
MGYWIERARQLAAEAHASPDKTDNKRETGELSEKALRRMTRSWHWMARSQASGV